jgi:hypothetical protein
MGIGMTMPPSTIQRFGSMDFKRPRAISTSNNRTMTNAKMTAEPESIAHHSFAKACVEGPAGSSADRSP